MATATKSQTKRLKLTAENYHEMTAFLSNSMAKDYDESPRLFEAKHITGTVTRKPTKLQDIGTVGHAAILEPHIIEDVCLEIPADVLNAQGHRKGKAWTEFVAENTDRILLTPTELAGVRGMFDAVYANELARKLLTSRGETETSIFWNCELTGLPRKCRPDKLTDSFAIDVKTTSDLSPEGFARIAARFRYYQQAEFYSDGVQALRGTGRRSCSSSSRPLRPTVVTSTSSTNEHAPSHLKSCAIYCVELRPATSTTSGRTRKRSKSRNCRCPDGFTSNQPTKWRVKTMSESNALALSQNESELARLDEIAKEASLQVVESYGNFKQALVMASAVRQMEQLISDEMMKDLMALQDTSLGFRTDKERDGGYPVAKVKACLIEATLRGVRMIGNEVNIISGRPYITKEGFTRLVREYPGLSDLRLMPEVPQTVGEKGALVGYRASWAVKGEIQELNRVKTEDGDCRIPVRVNSGMGTDAIIGKATRKMLAAIYGVLTGAHEAVPEGDVDELNGSSGKRATRSDVTDTVSAMQDGDAPMMPATDNGADGQLFETSPNAAEV